MTTTRDTTGKLHRAAGSPASTGGQFAAETAPAQAATLSRLSDSEKAWRSQRPTSSAEAREVYGPNGVFVVDALDTLAAMDDDSLRSIGEDSALLGLEPSEELRTARETTWKSVRPTPATAEQSVQHGQGVDEAILAAYGVAPRRNYGDGSKQSALHRGTVLAAAVVATIAASEATKDPHSTNAVAALRLNTLFARLDSSLVDGGITHSFAYQRESELASDRFESQAGNLR